ncbi:MAG TPA: hypothetical protein PLI95_10290 [Polyangiaceae bacterium]|nr:hypothetical protein [Polyangiaceae bacterium]
MYRRSRFAALATSSLFALVAVSSLVLAAPKDNAAKKLDKDAMESEFLNANFDGAEKKLQEAVKTCGEKDCTPKLKATVLIHLGIIQVNQSKAADAEKSFVEALKIDASVAPESDYVSPEVQKAFDAAKAKASGAAPAKTSDGGEQPEMAEGELNHVPVAEQMVDTPVPLWVEVPEGMKIGKVIVMYRPFGAEEWKKIELKKKKGGFGGDIPCADVGTTGDLKYYIKGLDPGGDPIAEVGNKNKPNITKIKNQLDGEPPHLPDTAPPAKCQSKGSCPPDFPGCQEQKCGKGGWGATCEKSKDCQCGFHCKKDEGKDEGVCEEGSDGSDGGGDEPGTDTVVRRKNWVSLWVSTDLAVISGEDVCSPANQGDSGYSCFRADNSQYYGQPVPGVGNSIRTGFAFSTVRILAGYDRLFGKNIMAGVRLGYAFNGGPTPRGANAFLPIHAEARGTYWFGKDPTVKLGIRPFAFAGIGMAQVDTKVEVSVKEPDNCTPYAGGCMSPTPDPANPEQWNPTGQTVRAWHKAGQQFVGLGGGAMYAFNQRSGVVLGLKYMLMFPTTGHVIAPEIGYVMGF